MKLEDQFKFLVGGYYGINLMDDYDLKVYILKEAENYIRNFIKENPIDNFDYKKEAENIKDNMPVITKLQDSLLVLKRIKGPIDLNRMVKIRIRSMIEK